MKKQNKKSILRGMVSTQLVAGALFYGGLKHFSFTEQLKGGNLETKVQSESEPHHIVKEGETLLGIAVKYNVPDYRTLAEYNRISNSDRIFPGQKILLPDSKPRQTQKSLERDVSNLSDPKYITDDNFASDSDAMVMARAIYGEARGELNGNGDYIYGFARSAINRAKARNKPVKDILLQNGIRRFKDKKGNPREVRVWQYTCFSPTDINYEKVKDPLKFETDEVWAKCSSLAIEFLEKNSSPKTDIQRKLQTATNYWVDFVPPPIWAYNDNDRSKGLREPLAVVPVNNKRNKAYFYHFRNF